jgi:hypothetical protein
VNHRVLVFARRDHNTYWTILGVVGTAGNSARLIVYGPRA